MWSRVMGKSKDKPDNSPSDSRSRDDERQRRPDSTVIASTRKPSRSDDRERGFNQASTNTSSSARNAYPGTASASVASSYVTASSKMPGEAVNLTDLEQNIGYTDKTPRPTSERDERDRHSRRRREHSLDDVDRQRKERSRSKDREVRKRERREKKRRDKDGVSTRWVDRSESLPGGYQGTDRAGEISAGGSASFSAQIGGSGFTQFPGQYDNGMPGLNSRPPRLPEISNHVPDQFPGQFPSDTAAPYRPPLAAGGIGLAADYYGDTGESVAHQPGVRPAPPSLIVGVQPHLMAASPIAAPPPEPSATGGVGAAASFFGDASFQSPAGSPSSGPQTGPIRPPIAHQSNTFSGPATIAGAAALGYVASTHGGPLVTSAGPSPSYPASTGPSPNSYSSTSKPPSNVYPPTSYHPQQTHPTDSAPSTAGYHSTSAPIIPTLGSAVAGAAAGYIIGSHTSSHHEGSANIGGSTADRIDNRPSSQRPPSQSGYAQGSHGGNNRPSHPGKSSNSSNVPLYAVGAVGAGSIAAAAHHHNHHSSPDQNYPGSLNNTYMTQKHRHHGPLGRLFDFFVDPDGVAQFEEYSEYVGVCRYCFEAGSSPQDAPRKHRYRPRSPKSMRVDKESRYSSSESDSRKKKQNSWFATGLAGYGLAKIGNNLFNSNHDFDDTYCVKSGRVNQSMSSVQGRHPGVSPDRRSYTSRGTVQRSNEDRSSYRYQSQEQSSFQERRDEQVYKSGLDGRAATTIHHVRRNSRSRSRSRSRSHSKRRRTRAAEVAIGAAAGASVVGSASRRRSKSPNDVRTKRESRQQVLEATHTAAAPKYVQMPGVYGESSDAPPSRRRSKSKRKVNNGFFSLGNGSSSSSDGLAFGHNANSSRKKKSSKSKAKDLTNPNSALLGLGTAVAVLAANEVYKGNKGKSKTRLGSGRKHDRNKYTSSSSADDMWEPVSDNEDNSSVNSVLAYGASRRKSQESLHSDSSGGFNWGWGRWGPKTKRKSSPATRHNVSGPVTHDMNFTGVSTNVDLAGRNGFHHDDGVSKTNSLPPLQKLFPMPISDPSRYDGEPQGLTAPEYRPRATSRPGPEIFQPQPVSSVSPAVFAAQVPYHYSHEVVAGSQSLPHPQGPIIVGSRAQEGEISRPVRLQHQSPVAEFREIPHDVKLRRRNSSPTPHIIEIEPRVLKKSSRRESASEVQFNIPKEQEQERNGGAWERTKTEPPPKNSRKAEQDSKQAKEIESQRSSVTSIKSVKARGDYEKKPSRSRDEVSTVSQRTKSEKGRVSSVVASGIGVAVIAAIGDKESPELRKTKVESEYIEELDREDRSPRKSKLKTVAAKTKRSVSPVHENYASYFVPPELLSKSNDAGQSGINHVTTFQVPEIITNEPAYSYKGPEEVVIYNPNLMMLPWHVPRLNLIQPTPPGSRAGSIRGDLSPVVHPVDSQAVEVEDSAKAQEKSTKVTFGDSETREYEVVTPVSTPIENREEFIKSPNESDKHKTTIDRKQAHGLTRSIAEDSPIEEIQRDHIPGEFGDDIDFAATVAAGLHDSGFDPAIVIDDPSFRRRNSPPGQTERISGYSEAYNVNIDDLGTNLGGVIGRSLPHGFVEEEELPPPPYEEPQALSSSTVDRENDVSLTGETESAQKTMVEPKQPAKKTTSEVSNFPVLDDNLARDGRVAENLSDRNISRSFSEDRPEEDRSIPSGIGSGLNERDRKVARESAKKIRHDDIPIVPLSIHSKPQSKGTFAKDVAEYHMEPQIIEAAPRQKPEGSDSLTEEAGPKLKDVKSGSGQFGSRNSDFYRKPAHTDEVRVSAASPSLLIDEQDRASQDEASKVPLPAESADDLRSVSKAIKIIKPDFEPSAVPLPEDVTGDFELADKSTESRSPESLQDIDLYESATEDVASAAASAPLPEEYGQVKKSKRKSKRRDTDYSDSASIATAPVAYAEAKEINSKNKKGKDKKGGLYGLFSKIIDSSSEQKGSRDTPVDATLADFEEPKKKRKSKDKKSSRGGDDSYSIASQSAVDLPAQLEEVEQDKPVKPRDKEKRQRAHKESRGDGNSGRIAQDLSAKNDDLDETKVGVIREYLDEDDGQNDNQSPKISEEPSSFLGVRREITEPPDLHEIIKAETTVVDPLHQTTLYDTISREEFGQDLPSLPASRPTSPTAVGRAQDLPALPSSQPGSPMTTPARAPRNLVFRTPLSSAGLTRSSPSTPLASPLQTPRHRQGRPSSTEFRPLYLVERHNARRDIVPTEETYPELPPSVPSSRASSEHDGEEYGAHRDFIHRQTAVNELPTTPGADQDHAPDFLDSQQTTPTATSFPIDHDIGFRNDIDYESSYQDVIAADIIADHKRKLASKMHSSLQESGTRSMESSHQKGSVPLSPKHDIDNMTELPPLPESKEDLRMHEILSGLDPKPISDRIFDHEANAEEDALVHSIDNHLEKDSREPDMEKSYDAQPVIFDDFPAMKSNSKKTKKLRSGGKRNAQDTDGSTSMEVSVPTTPSKMVKHLSMEEKRATEEQDTQVAVDSWFAPSPVKNLRKGKDKKKPPALKETKVAATSGDVLDNTLIRGLILSEPTENSLSPSIESGSKNIDFQALPSAREDDDKSHISVAGTTEGAKAVDEELREQIAPKRVSENAEYMHEFNPKTKKGRKQKGRKVNIDTLPESAALISEEPGFISRRNEDKSAPIISSIGNQGQVSDETRPESGAGAVDIRSNEATETGAKSLQEDPLTTQKRLPPVNYTFDELRAHGDTALSSKSADTAPELNPLVGEVIAPSKSAKKNRKGKKPVPLNTAKIGSISQAKTRLTDTPITAKKKGVSRSLLDEQVASDSTGDYAGEQLDGNRPNVGALNREVALASPEDTKLPLDDDLDLLDALPESPGLSLEPVRDAIPSAVLVPSPEDVELPRDDDLDLLDALPKSPLLLASAEEVKLPLDDDLDLLDALPGSLRLAMGPTNEAIPSAVLVPSPEDVELPRDDDLDLLDALPKSPLLLASAEEVKLPLADDLDLLDALPESPVLSPEDTSGGIHTEVLSASPEGIKLPLDDDLDLLDALPKSPAPGLLAPSDAIHVKLATEQITSDRDGFKVTSPSTAYQERLGFERSLLLPLITALPADQDLDLLEALPESPTLQPQSSAQEVTDDDREGREIVEEIETVSVLPEDESAIRLLHTESTEHAAMKSLAAANHTPIIIHQMPSKTDVDMAPEDAAQPTQQRFTLDSSKTEISAVQDSGDLQNNKVEAINLVQTSEKSNDLDDKHTQATFGTYEMENNAKDSSSFNNKTPAHRNSSEGSQQAHTGDDSQLDTLLDDVAEKNAEEDSTVPVRKKGLHGKKSRQIQPPTSVPILSSVTEADSAALPESQADLSREIHMENISSKQSNEFTQEPAEEVGWASTKKSKGKKGRKAQVTTQATPSAGEPVDFSSGPSVPEATLSSDQPPGQSSGVRDEVVDDEWALPSKSKKGEKEKKRAVEVEPVVPASVPDAVEKTLFSDQIPVKSGGAGNDVDDEWALPSKSKKGKKDKKQKELIASYQPTSLQQTTAESQVLSASHERLNSPANHEAEIIPSTTVMPAASISDAVEAALPLGINSETPAEADLLNRTSETREITKDLVSDNIPRTLYETQDLAPPEEEIGLASTPSANSADIARFENPASTEVTNKSSAPTEVLKIQPHEDQDAIMDSEGFPGINKKTKSKKTKKNGAKSFADERSGGTVDVTTDKDVVPSSNFESDAAAEGGRVESITAEDDRLPSDINDRTVGVLPLTSLSTLDETSDFFSISQVRSPDDYLDAATTTALPIDTIKEPSEINDLSLSSTVSEVPNHSFTALEEVSKIPLPNDAADDFPVMSDISLDASISEASNNQVTAPEEAEKSLLAIDDISTDHERLSPPREAESFAENLATLDDAIKTILPVDKIEDFPIHGMSSSAAVPSSFPEPDLTLSDHNKSAIPEFYNLPDQPSASDAQSFISHDRDFVVGHMENSPEELGRLIETTFEPRLEEDIPASILLKPAESNDTPSFLPQGTLEKSESSGLPVVDLDESHNDRGQFSLPVVIDESARGSDDFLPNFEKRKGKRGKKFKSQSQEQDTPVLDAQSQEEQTEKQTPLAPVVASANELKLSQAPEIEMAGGAVGTSRSKKDKKNRKKSKIVLLESDNEPLITGDSQEVSEEKQFGSAPEASRDEALVNAPTQDIKENALDVREQSVLEESYDVLDQNDRLDRSIDVLRDEQPSATTKLQEEFSYERPVGEAPTSDEPRPSFVNATISKLVGDEIISTKFLAQPITEESRNMISEGPSTTPVDNSIGELQADSSAKYSVDKSDFDQYTSEAMNSSEAGRQELVLPAVINDDGIKDATATENPVVPHKAAAWSARDDPVELSADSYRGRQLTPDVIPAEDLLGPDKSLEDSAEGKRNTSNALGHPIGAIDNDEPFLSVAASPQPRLPTMDQVAINDTPSIPLDDSVEVYSLKKSKKNKKNAKNKESLDSANKSDDVAPAPETSIAFEDSASSIAIENTTKAPVPETSVLAPQPLKSDSRKSKKDRKNRKPGKSGWTEELEEPSSAVSNDASVSAVKESTLESGQDANKDVILSSLVDVNTSKRGPDVDWSAETEDTAPAPVVDASETASEAARDIEATAQEISIPEGQKGKKDKKKGKKGKVLHQLGENDDLAQADTKDFAAFSVQDNVIKYVQEMEARIDTPTTSDPKPSKKSKRSGKTVSTFDWTKETQDMESPLVPGKEADISSQLHLPSTEPKDEMEAVSQQLDTSDFRKSKKDKKKSKKNQSMNWEEEPSLSTTLPGNDSTGENVPKVSPETRKEIRNLDTFRDLRSSDIDATASLPESTFKGPLLVQSSELLSQVEDLQPVEPEIIKTMQIDDSHPLTALEDKLETEIAASQPANIPQPLGDKDTHGLLRALEPETSLSQSENVEEWKAEMQFDEQERQLDKTKTGNELPEPLSASCAQPEPTNDHDFAGFTKKQKGKKGSKGKKADSKDFQPGPQISDAPPNLQEPQILPTPADTINDSRGIEQVSSLLHDDISDSDLIGQRKGKPGKMQMDIQDKQEEAQPTFAQQSSIHLPESTQMSKSLETAEMKAKEIEEDPVMLKDGVSDKDPVKQKKVRKNKKKTQSPGGEKEDTALPIDQSLSTEANPHVKEILPISQDIGNVSAADESDRATPAVHSHSSELQDGKATQSFMAEARERIPSPRYVDDSNLNQFQEPPDVIQDNGPAHHHRNVKPKSPRQSRFLTRKDDSEDDSLEESTPAPQIARATTVGVGIALFEGLQREGSRGTTKGKKDKKKRRAADLVEVPVPEPSGHHDASLDTLGKAVAEASSIPFQPLVTDHLVKRDSAVHVSDSPILPSSSYNIRDSGYQGTEASPDLAHNPNSFEKGQMQYDDNHPPELSRVEDDRDLHATYDDTDKEAAFARNPLKIEVEVAPTYYVSITTSETKHGEARGPAKDEEFLSDKAYDPDDRYDSTVALPVSQDRQPSPVDSTSKERSSALFQSSPSTRDDAVNYSVTDEGYSPTQVPKNRGIDVETRDEDEISTPMRQSSYHNGSPIDVQASRPEHGSSLFGGPIGINSESDYVLSPPRTPLGHDNSSRRKLMTIDELSSSDSPSDKKSKELHDVGVSEHGLKLTPRSSTPRALSNQRGRSLIANERADSGPLSTDDLISRLSWPPVDEDNQSVDLERSKSRDTDPTTRSLSRQSNLAALVTSQGRQHDADRRSVSGASIRSNESINAIIRPADGHSPQTPPLRRETRSISSDLRAANQRSDAKKLAKPAEAQVDFAPEPGFASSSTYNPATDKGKNRITKMADVYEGWGADVHDSPLSPTRPPSMRKRQSMQILDLETRLDQLVSENRLLLDAKSRAERSLDDAVHDHSQENDALNEALQTRDLFLKQKDSELVELQGILDGLHAEVSRLTEVNDGLAGAREESTAEHEQKYTQLQAEHARSHEEWQDSSRELESLRHKHTSLSGGVEGIVAQEVSVALQRKDLELQKMREELETTKEQVRTLQQQILASRRSDEFLVARDEDYFDGQCQQLCQHVQQWVLRFSKFSDSKASRLINEVSDEKIADRFDNAILDGSDVNIYLADRVKRRDVFMSVVMNMVWEYVFTRYLFGMDREQRQKLKSLEKTLSEVGSIVAVNKWRATTLTLLSKRQNFLSQREQDTEAVVQEIFHTVAAFLTPPSHLVNQILDSLRKVLRAAVELSIEMRTQRADYVMLPPLQPEYDTNGDLSRQFYFNASLMNERSGDTTSNEELAARRAVVRMVLFPLVVKKGDDRGVGEEEIVVCPAQVLIGGKENEKKGGGKSMRVVSAQGDRIEGLSMGNRSVGSFAPSTTDAAMGGMI